MDRVKIVSVMVIFLVLLVISTSFAQVSSQEGENTYATEGTRELGLNGSITLPTVYTDAPSDWGEDDGLTMIMMQPFFKYFFRDRIHFDIRWTIMNISMEASGGGDDMSMSISVFSPSIGYTYPLSPKLQVDVAANLGLASYTLDAGGGLEEDSSISYGLSFMGLTPVSESAVIGIGIIFTWTTMDIGEDVTLLQRMIPITVSYYF